MPALRGRARRRLPLSVWVGGGFLLAMVLACIGSLPWTLGAASAGGGLTARYKAGEFRESLLPPVWWGARDEVEARRLNSLVDPDVLQRLAAARGVEVDELVKLTGRDGADVRTHWPTRERPVAFLLGSDSLGRSVFVRCLTGGGVSLCIGIAAAALSVMIGTLYGAIAGYAGGVVDGVMMRIVDILYGLPYVLLVVLLAVAVDAAVENWIEARVRAGGAGVVSAEMRSVVDVVVLLVAIGGVSWLTMARVVRGQVLSLKSQPFMEAARAMGVGWFGQFRRHLLPNLVGPIIVYATLTVPQAILQESFLSFLGIGVKPPLPSWGNLAADGLSELNPVRSNWWLLVFPCVLLGMTLLALNVLGEGMREAFDPKRGRR
ncbi:MAG: ABC transporter permease [Phycisphaeraceae bacterium]|nr:ABC transporter permease [Phycisphaeraceae bacterium]